jgi:hypothetical protein
MIACFCYKRAVENPTQSKTYFSSNIANIVDFAMMNNAAVDQDETHPTTVNWVFFQGIQKHDPSKPIEFTLCLFPGLMTLPKPLEHWLTLMGRRRNNKWLFWPECTVRQMKIVLSCFLVNVAPGNLKLEITKKQTAPETEQEEGGTTTVELDDGQVLSDLLEGQGGTTRWMEVTVRKNREDDLRDSYKLPGKHTYNRIPVPKIPKKLLGTARMIIEDHWLEFVTEHKTLLNRFFDTNKKYFDDWDDARKDMYFESRHKHSLVPGTGTIDDMLKRQLRSQSHRRRMQQQQEEQKENLFPDDQYTLVYNLYFNGNPRGC